MGFIIKYFIIISLVTIGTFSYFLTTTPAGLQLELEWIARCLPGKLKIEKISGSLFSDFSLQNISYQTPQQQIKIKSFRVQWRPQELLKGKIFIDTLLIENAKIQLSTASLPTNNLNQANLKANYASFLQYIQLNNFIIRDLTINTTQVTLKVNGELKNNWNLQWKINIPNFALFNHASTGDLFASGNLFGPRYSPSINAQLKANQLAFAKQSIGKLIGQANIVVKPKINSSLKLTAYDTKIGNYSFKKIDMSVSGYVTYLQQTLATLLKVTINNQPTVSLSLSLPHFSGFIKPTQPILGKIQVNFSTLKGLTYFISSIKAPYGIIQGNIALNGTLSQPIFFAKFNLHDGRFFIPDLGISPEKINLDAFLDKEKILFLNGNFQIGQGKAELKGSIDLNQAKFPLNLTVKGNHLQIVNLSEYKATISPDLQLNLTLPNLKLEGTILISQATISPKNFSSTVSLPDEVIIVDELHKSTSSISLLSTLQLNIHLGDKIYVNYKNLQTQLGGNLVITKNPASPATATGELYTLHGKYSAYSRVLTIQEGRLIYAGNTLTNPGLNIRATQQFRGVVTSSSNSFVATTSDKNTPAATQSMYLGMEDITVGVQVSGTTDSPQYTLFSIPSGLSQGDMLSYLILGYPQSQASGNQGAALLSALSTLKPGTSSFSNITTKLQKTLGLTELNVESIQTFNPTTQSVESVTSFVVGKQLTNKLSLHYSIGLFNPISILNLRYQLSKRWALQSETSSIDNGADLLYSIEQD